MRTVGIVCEYNPFHTGHKRQIDILRKNGAKAIICAMSGNFTQRGEMTIADKYARAEAAIKCGADIVLELPFPYSSMSAEGFCSAGVHILSSVGCDTLSFGSESADKDLLLRAADLINSERFISAYTEASKNQGAARSYFELLSELLGNDAPLLSNDILGISYIAAIKRSGASMDIFPIHRLGAAYNETALGAEFPSATALRAAIKGSQDGFFAVDSQNIPMSALEALQKAQNCKHAPVSTNIIDSDILSFFRLMAPDEIISRAVKKSGGGENVASDGCGIVERLCSCARSASDFDIFINSAYNSRYTDARINRVMLFSLLGVSDIFEKSLPEYTTLLGAGEAGRKYLSEIRKTSTFPIITKPADAPSGSLVDLIRLSDSFYASAMGQGTDIGYFMKKHPFMG